MPRHLRRVLSPRWEVSVAGDMLEIRHPDRATPYRPPRIPASPLELLDSLQTAFTELGVPRAACLPLRWGRETELTISAVQALDPWLKEERGVALRTGFLPQPVVRLTARRNADGMLREGFLTAFINASRVEPIQGMSEYATVFDQWLSVLSRLGFHARHICIYGHLTVWQRRQVKGVTLRFDHAGMPLGDIVLLWNADNPGRMAVDLGTSLERLCWARSRRCWLDVVFGELAAAAPANTLDAIRSATLLIGHGVFPSGRGAGSITRRLARAIPANEAALGLSAAIRLSYRFWSSVAPLTIPWTDVVAIIEREVLANLAWSATSANSRSGMTAH